MRNYKMDFYKIVLTIIVVIGHSFWISDGCEFFSGGGGRAVECFFIISGYYMMVSFNKRVDYYKNPIDNVISFAKDRISFYYPHYLVSFCMVFATMQLFKSYAIYNKGGNIISNFLMDCYKALPEIVGLQMFGLLDTNNYYNQPTWYLCSMIIVTIIFYCFLSYNNKLFQYIIAPMLGLFLLGWRFSNGTYGVHHWDDYVGFVPLGVIRAACDICLGIMCYTFVMYIKEKNFSKRSKILFTIIEVTGWFLLCYSCHIKIDANNGIWILFGFSLLVLSLSNISYVGNWLKWKGFGFLSKYSFSLYMTHYVAVRSIPSVKVLHERSYLSNLPLFILICIVAVFIEMWCVKIFNKWTNASKGSQTI